MRLYFEEAVFFEMCIRPPRSRSDELSARILANNSRYRIAKQICSLATTANSLYSASHPLRQRHGHKNLVALCVDASRHRI